MKSDTLPNNLPNNPEAWEKLIADAPGEDRLPTSAEAAAWHDAVVVREGGLPTVRAALAGKRRLRGAQKAVTKVPTTIRFDADVLAALKASGRGWQTRVNEAVRDWLKAHSAV